MAFLLSPAPDVSSSRPLLPFKLHSFSTLWGWGLFNRNCTFRHFPNRCVSITNVVYAEDVIVPGTAKSARRRDQIELERDSISVLNERILRFHGKRDSSRTAMDSEEADRYIQMVKEQQQRGLQKLKGDRQRKESDGFNYKVDPYTLRSGDYVVHKKVGIGRFVGIKFDVQKGSTEAIEYVFIEYADGMAKLPVKQASRMLYRYSLPNENKKPRTLSKLNDTTTWEKRKTKGKIAIQKMVVDLMELYLHRLKQRRSPYPKCSAMEEFSAQFPYEPTVDQKEVLSLKKASALPFLG